MKKFGFTLAEVLISLLVVGIVAALVAPTITKIMPNREKILVIKAYKALHETTTMLIEDPMFYLNGSTLGLADLSAPQPLYMRNNKFKDRNKYCNLLAENMNSFSKNLTTTGASSWVTEDFMSWFCQYQYSSNTATVTVDINGEDSPNCEYGSDCQNPDRYSFTVATDGYVTGKDRLTQVYLDTMDRLNDKKADYAEL